MLASETLQLLLIFGGEVIPFMFFCGGFQLWEITTKAEIAVSLMGLMGGLG